MKELEIIKIIVSGVFELDLSVRCRERKYVNARACYYELCKKYSKEATLESIGELIDRDHASVIYNVSNVDWYKKKHGFKKLHFEAENKVREAFKHETKIKKSTSVVEHFSNRYDIVQRKNQYLMKKIINNGSGRIKHVLEDLDPAYYNELIETRIKPFIMMRRNLNGQQAEV